MRWVDFEMGAPELGRIGRSLIERLGFVYVGTVRRDGSPRISPVEAHIVRGRLMLVMIAASRKAHDLACDPRVTLQSPVPNARDPGVELKVRGRVTEADEEQQEATTEAVETRSGWRPQPSWRFFAVDIEAVAVLVWDQGEMIMRRWNPHEGLRGPTRLRLDAAASAYRTLR